MTDSKRLREKINEKGVSITFLAGRLGVSREGLYNKLNGDTEFKASEIYALRKILDLSHAETDLIFFAQKGE